MLLTSHDYQTVHILWAACMCLCVFLSLMQITGEPLCLESCQTLGQGQSSRDGGGGGGGGGEGKRGGEVCRDTVELYRQMLQEDLQ